jgi:RNA-directed DNA polymerase
MSDLKRWEKHFKDSGLREDLISAYLKYIDKILSNNLPVIFEFHHLALLLGRTDHYLSSVISSPKSFYRTFSIPKRNGGERSISSPYPSLLECQQWINRNILAKIAIHPSSHGFTNDRSIITNAKLHLSKPILLKIDLRNFFSTIKIERIIKVFRKLGYPKNVSFYLASLCCLNGVLPQGAATSPTLSNIISRILDKRLHKLSEKFNLTYSRYADDMTFSGEIIPDYFISLVEEIIEDEGFQINENKTLLVENSKRQIVTGLSVSGKELKIPRNYKRKLRQEIHFIISFGYYSHLSKLKIKDPFYIDSIYGKLLFWKSIEPENPFVNKTIPIIKKLKMDGSYREF